MKTLKKFNSKAMIKSIKEDCDKLSTDELIEMQKGLAMFINIYRNYDMKIYGSSKRIIDLLQYGNLISNLTFIRIKKESNNVPY